jgi:hypothetical protein
MTSRRKDLAAIAASLVFVGVILFLAIIGAVLLVPF